MAQTKQGKQTILVVDDDADYVEMNRVVLEKAGYAVITAYNATECMKTLTATVPDLIILDVMMGKMTDGFFATYDIRKNPNVKNVPILMVTAVNTTVPYRFEPDDQYLPVDKFIDKPIAPKVLIETVQAMLAKAAGGKP
ncbi:MAG: response regulator [Planctomycetota bacterium]